MALRKLKPPLEALRGVGAVIAGTAGSAISQRADRVLRRGHYRAPLSFPADRVALLFFEDVESDLLVRNDRYPRRTARKLYHAVTRGQAVSGFEMAFRCLCRALEQVGWQVVVNDRELARRNPRHPIGIAGYPHVLNGWDLPNPAVLGPGLLDHPGAAPRLMEDERFRSYIVGCEWVGEMFRSAYGERCVRWFAGVDTSAWPDLSSAHKDLDFLVYEKFHWVRNRREREILRPLLAEIGRRGLTAHVLHYGKYELPEYRALLARARALAWLSEHETQGIAYQEAMASGLPVLAWDQGAWLDPNRLRWSEEPIAASSVPYFAPGCGERFSSIEQLPSALDRFVAGRERYEPRRFVLENLSLRASAEAWLAAAMSAA